MIEQALGLTTRFSLTATSMGTRKDILNRRVATNLGVNPNFNEQSFTLTANNEGRTVTSAKREFEGIAKFFLIHSDMPLEIVITDLDDGAMINFTMEDFFIVTAAFAKIEVYNISLTERASVNVVCA